MALTLGLFSCRNNHQVEEHSALAMNLPDVLLLDLQLPDVQDTELVRQILTRYPDLRILIVTSVDNPYRARDLIKLGCAGYLIKSTTPETLIEAIETVYRGEEFLEPKLKDQILTAVLRSTKKNGNHSTLTKRERETLELICEGLNNYDIGEKLFISHRTVENHRLSLHQKFEVKNSAALVNKAYKLGII